MRFILALILLGFLLTYFLFTERAGLKDLNFNILAFTRTIPGKMFFIAAITSVIAVVLMLLTGVICISDMIELDRKMTEFCPFCLAAQLPGGHMIIALK